MAVGRMEKKGMDKTRRPMSGYFDARKRSGVALRLVLCIALVFSLIQAQSFSNREAYADTAWTAQDFLVSGDTIVGLSAQGTQKLSDSSGVMRVPQMEGVTSLTAGFSNIGIISLTIDGGYTVIGDNVFQSNAITALNLPNSIQSIGKSAFQNNQLTSVKLPSGLTSLGDSAFASNLLSSIAWNNADIDSVSDSAFKDNCLNELFLPASVTSISVLAFADNDITRVSLPGVTTIGSQAFYNNALSTIAHEDMPLISSVADNAFTNNGRVVAIHSNNSIRSSFGSAVGFSIGSGHVVNPVTITVKYLDEEGLAVKSEDVLGTDFTSDDLYPEGVEATISAPHVSGYAPMPENIAQTVTVSSGMELLFSYRSVVADPVITVSQLLYLTGMNVDDGVLLSNVSAVSGVDGSAISAISVILESTGESAFTLDTSGPGIHKVTYRVEDSYGNVGSKSVDIRIMLDPLEDYIGASQWQYRDFEYSGSTLNGLSDFGKTKYESYKDLTLPGMNPYTGETITVIRGGGSASTGAFSATGYDAYTSVDFSNCPDLVVIGKDAFHNVALTTLDLSCCTALTTIGESSFRKAALSSLDLSFNTALTSIDSYAFADSVLLSLDISGCGELAIIDESAFFASKLTELDLTQNTALATFGNYAFRNSVLTELDLSQNAALNTIGYAVFRNSKLTELDFSGCPELTVIGQESFNSSVLTKLNLTKNTKLTTIGEGAFLNAKLTELDLAQNSELKYIGAYAFYTSVLTELDFTRNTALYYIGSNAFNKARLTELDFTQCSLLETLGDSAFYNSAITELDLTHCTHLKTLGASVFYSAKLTELDLSNNKALTEISKRSFYLSELVRLDMPENGVLQIIGESAFVNAKLIELDFKGSATLASIDDNAFKNSPLTTLNLSNCPDLVAIRDSAFYSARITELDLRSCTRLATIGNYSFYNSPLETVVIGTMKNTRGNIYNLAGPVRSYCVTSYDRSLPIYILDNPSGISSHYGYRVNPVKVTTNYVEQGTNKTIYPSQTQWISWPFEDYDLPAREIFGYTPVNATETVTPGITEAPDPLEIQERELTFFYTKRDASDYEDWKGIEISQWAIDDYVHIGDMLSSRVGMKVTNYDGGSIKGMQIKLFYDADRFNADKISITPDPAFSTDTKVPGVITFTILEEGNGQSFDFSAAIFWYLKPGVTEEYREFPVTAELWTAAGQGGEQDLVGQGNTISLSGYYLDPKLTLLANGDSQNKEVHYATIDENTDRYENEDISVTYQPVITDLERNVESVTYTVNLPSYPYFNEGTGTWETRLAGFDQTKNPGWVLSNEGTHVTYTLERLNTSTLVGPYLVLDYYGIKPFTVVSVDASFVAEPYQKTETERSFSDTDDIFNSFSGSKIPSGHIFHKYAGDSNYTAIFYDTKKSKAQEFDWSLTVATSKVPSGGYLGDLVVYDESLDSRMYYSGIDVGDSLAGATVNGYNNNGDLVFSVSGVEDRVQFPASTTGNVTDNDIAYVEVDASMLKIAQWANVRIKLYSKLKNPASIDYDDCAANSSLHFANTGGVSAGHYYNSEGVPGGAISASETAHWRMAEYKVSIRLEKGVQNKKDVYFSNDTVTYSLRFGYYLNEEGSVPAASLDTVVKDFVAYDVLPQYMTAQAFAPSEGLVQGATNLNYELLGAYYEDNNGILHDVVRVTADEVDLSFVDTLGKVSAAFDYTLPADARLTNEAYVDFEVEDEKSKLTLLDTDDSDDNPFDKSGVLTGSVDVGVAAATVFRATKQIRVEMGEENGSSVWGPWQSSIITLPDTKFQYRLLLNNGSSADEPRRNISLVDVLPTVGDTEIVQNGDRRGSQFENTLLKVEAPAGYSVLYLASAEPINYGGLDADAYFDAANWKSAVELGGDFSEVRAIKIESKSATEGVVGRGELLEVCVTMQAPDSVELDTKRALNSFVRRDNMQTTYIEAAPVYNEIYKPATIKLSKFRGATGYAALSGAVFGLYDSTGANLLATATSDGLGELYFKNLKRDNYVLKELTAPEGYELLSDPIQVAYTDFVSSGVDYEHIASYSVRNTQSPVYGQFKLLKVDGNGALLKGVSFTLTSTTDSSLSYSAITNEGGELLLSQVLIGTYRVTENSTPNHLQALPAFNITIAKDKNFVSGTWPSQASLNGSGTVLTVVNNRASATIYKLGISNADLFDVDESDLRPNSGRPLPKVTLKLYKEDGSFVSDYTTSSKGSVTMLDLEVNQVYYLDEVGYSVPEGWELAERVYFKVDAAGVIHQVFMDDSGNIESEKPFLADAIIVKDLPKPASATLYIDKYDERGNLLAGAGFLLEKQTGVDTWEELDRFVSNGVDQIVKQNLSGGTYRLSEEYAPEGYLKSNQVHTFTVVDGKENAQAFSFEYGNAKIEPVVVKGDYVDTFHLDVDAEVIALDRAVDYLETQGYHPQKMYGNNNSVTLLAGLKGAKFEVAEYAGLSTSGTPVATYAIISGDDGRFDLTAASPQALVFKSGHSYTFTETEAPKGYQKTEGVVKVYQPDLERENILKNGGMWIGLENRVDDHKIIVSKYATDTMAGLAGVTFRLLNPDGTQAVSTKGDDLIATADNKGFIEFADLVPGTYYAEETANPSGYTLLDGYYKVIVEGETDVALSDIPNYVDAIGADPSNTIHGVQTTEGSATIVAYNTREIDPYSLTLQKAVAGKANPTDTFEFLVEFKDSLSTYEPYVGPYTLYSNASDMVGQTMLTATGKVILGAGQRATIPGLAAGDQYQVSENTSASDFAYAVSASKNGGTAHVGSVYTDAVDGQDVVTFTNTFEHSLKLEKIVTGLSDPTADRFSFLVEFKGAGGWEPYVGNYTKYAGPLDVAGVPASTTDGVVALSHGEHLVIADRNENEDYRITEALSGLTYDYTVTGGEIGDVATESAVVEGRVNGATEVRFTNVAEHSLTLEKVVEGLNDPTVDDFAFTVEFFDGVDAWEPYVGDYLLFENASALTGETRSTTDGTLVLEQGQHMTISGLSENDRYRITEDMTGLTYEYVVTSGELGSAAVESPVLEGSIDGGAMVRFTNTIHYGLEIAKLVEGLDDANKATREFSFLVELFDTGSGDYDAFAGDYVLYPADADADAAGQPMTTNNGVITLSHGQSAVIPGLAENDEYRVTEDTTGVFPYMVENSINGGETQDGNSVEGMLEPAGQVHEVMFVNTYGATPIDPQFKATKTMVGRALAADEFNFTAKLIAGDPTMIEGLTQTDEGDYLLSATNTADGSILFPSIMMDTAGNYIFEISEQQGTLADVTYSDKRFYADVVVTEDYATGELTELVSYYGSYDAQTGFDDLLTDESQVEFVNTYAPKKDDEDKEDPKEDPKKKDVEVSKTVDKTQARPGDILTYTIRVKNTGEVELKNFQIRDTLDSRLSYVDSDNKGVMSAVDGKEVVTWLIDRLAVGEQVELHLKATIKKDAAEGVKISNTAFYDPNEDDPSGPTDREVPSNAAETVLLKRDSVILLTKTGDDSALWIVVSVLLIAALVSLRTRTLKSEKRYKK